MTTPTPELPAGDWPVSFDQVRVTQHLRFRALPAREKIQAMADMAEIAEAARLARARASKERCSS